MKSTIYILLKNVFMFLCLSFLIYIGNEKFVLYALSALVAILFADSNLRDETAKLACRKMAVEFHNKLAEAHKRVSRKRKK
jgi:hypothetical protein